MLIGLLDDPAAPLYVLRLWAHCQNRRQDTFENLPARALCSLCHFPGNPSKLESSLVDSGFIRRDDSERLIVEGWADYNASLIASWRNGKKGGRPPLENPEETHGYPTGIPRVHDKSREEKIGVDKKHSKREPPTLEEVRAYFAEKGTLIDPEQFFAHYDANGWRQANGNPIKNWKSCLVTWEKNERERKGNHASRNSIPAGAGQRYDGKPLGKF